MTRKMAIDTSYVNEWKVVLRTIVNRYKLKYEFLEIILYTNS